MIHVKHYVFKVNSQENLKNLYSVVYEAKDMKFCRQVPRTYVHKRLVLDFHLFA